MASAKYLLDRSRMYICTSIFFVYRCVLCVFALKFIFHQHDPSASVHSHRLTAHVQLSCVAFWQLPYVLPHCLLRQCAVAFSSYGVVFSFFFCIAYHYLWR